MKEIEPDTLLLRVPALTWLAWHYTLWPFSPSHNRRRRVKLEHFQTNFFCSSCFIYEKEIILDAGSCLIAASVIICPRLPVRLLLLLLHHGCSSTCNGSEPTAINTILFACLTGEREWKLWANTGRTNIGLGKWMRVRSYLNAHWQITTHLILCSSTASPQDNYRIINTRRRRFCPELISVINIRIPASAPLLTDVNEKVYTGHSSLGRLELTLQPAQRSVALADGSFKTREFFAVFQQFRTQRIFLCFYCWLQCRWMDGGV